MHAAAIRRTGTSPPAADGTGRVSERIPPAAATRHTSAGSQNTDRQPSAPVSAPPSTGPIATAVAPTALHVASALARSAVPLADALTTASAAGLNSAPPTPCTSRPTTSASGVPAAAQPSDPTENSAIPSTNGSRGPSRSAAYPPSSRQQPNARL